MELLSRGIIQYRYQMIDSASFDLITIKPVRIDTFLSESLTELIATLSVPFRVVASNEKTALPRLRGSLYAWTAFPWRLAFSSECFSTRLRFLSSARSGSTWKTHSFSKHGKLYYWLSFFLKQPWGLLCRVLPSPVSYAHKMASKRLSALTESIKLKNDNITLPSWHTQPLFSFSTQSALRSKELAGWGGKH